MDINLDLLISLCPNQTQTKDHKELCQRVFSGIYLSIFVVLRFLNLELHAC
jgi:hypothetical protein